MSTNTYGGAVIVPLRTSGELRIEYDGQKDRVGADRALDIADALEESSIPSALVRVDDPKAVAAGIREQVSRLEGSA